MSLVRIICDFKNIQISWAILLAVLVAAVVSALIMGAISLCIKKEQLECLVIPICILSIWILSFFGLSLLAIIVSLIAIERNISENDFRNICAKGEE